MPIFRILFLSILLGSASLNAQTLTWQYEDILTDNKESGAYPDLFIDPAGNFHVSFWDVQQNALRYAYRPSGSGTWTLETIAPSMAGIRSAIVANAQGVVHVVYLAQEGEEADLSYAIRTNGSWTTESLGNDTLVGPYGLEVKFPVYRQPSVDIALSQSGKPFITFFHSWIGQYFICAANTISSYYRYTLELRILVKESDGSWSNSSIPNLSNLTGTSCIPNGDRFGEFCQIAPGPGGRHYVLTQSNHNHQLVIFQADDATLHSWTHYVADTLTRIRPASQISFFDTFEFPAIASGNDTTLHLAYGVSTLFGNQSLQAARRAYFYGRVNPAKLTNGSDNTAFFKDMDPTRDGIYRRYFSIQASGRDSVFETYYDELNGKIVTAFTSNGGSSFVRDTVFSIVTNTRIATATYGDSLYVLAYDANRDEIVMGAKRLITGNWVRTQVTSSQRRAKVIDGEVLRMGADDQVFIAYDETNRGQLFLSTRLQGNWTTQTVDNAGHDYSSVSMELDTDGQPVMAYAWRESDQLRIVKQGNSPVTITMPSGNKPRQAVIKRAADGWHLAYYDFAGRKLMYGFAGQWSGPWTIETADASAANIGQYPALAVTAQNEVYLAYFDLTNKHLKVSFKPTGGSWQPVVFQDTTERQITGIQIALNDSGYAFVAYRDGLENSVRMAKGSGVNAWTEEEIVAEIGNLIGAPLDILTDHAGRPWIMYNYSEAVDGVQLSRQDNQGVWQEVSVIPNPGQISNAFIFRRAGYDFYLAGKKNLPTTGGISLLYAESGALTRIDEPRLTSAPLLVPNPATDLCELRWSAISAGKFEATLFDLSGRRIATLLNEQLPAGEGATSFSTDGLTPGVYVVHMSGEKEAWTVRLVVLAR